MKLEVGKTYRNKDGLEITIDYFFYGVDGLVVVAKTGETFLMLARSEWKEVRPENKWLKTGWVRYKGSPKFRTIISGYDEGKFKRYTVGGVARTETEMEEMFTPCESPIGGEG